MAPVTAAAVAKSCCRASLLFWPRKAFREGPTKAKARVDDDLLAINQRLLRPVHAVLEIGQHRFGRVGQVPELGPCLGCPAHMVQDQPRVLGGNDVSEPRIDRQIRGVVDERHPVLQRLRRHAALVGIHRDRDRQAALEPLEHGNQPA
jgi:hypothetical protein